VNLADFFAATLGFTGAGFVSTGGVSATLCGQPCAPQPASRTCCAPGQAQPSYDKQYVRNWLLQESGWDRNSPPPPLPAEVVEQTRARYVEAYERITGRPFAAPIG